MGTIGIGLVGAGYMGKRHAVALKAVGPVFNTALRPVCELICSTTASGAAASPNMGYHTSPVVAVLLTVFNVRLGQWFGNPRDPRCWRNVGFFRESRLQAAAVLLTRALAKQLATSRA